MSPTPKDLQIAQLRLDLQRGLAAGDQSPLKNAIRRRKLELLENDPAFSNVTNDKATLFEKLKEKAVSQVAYEQSRRSEWTAKRKLSGFKPTFNDFVTMIGGTAARYKTNSLTPVFIQLFKSAMQQWYASHPVNKAFLDLSIEKAIEMYFKESVVMITLFSIIHDQGHNLDRSPIKPAVELAVQVASILEPTVGIYTGWTADGIRKINMTEDNRGVLACAFLVPLVGRFFKGSSAVYSRTQELALFGIRDPKGSSSPFQFVAGAAAQKPLIHKMEIAEQGLQKGPISNSIAQDAVNAFNTIKNSTDFVDAEVDSETLAFWQQLGSKIRSLTKLDEYAARRILAARPVKEHVGGRIIEELAEVQFNNWLRDPHVGSALGLNIPEGKKLEFFPGHMVRAESGRQVTDGILGYWNRGTQAMAETGAFIIVAILEVKTSKQGTRELSFSETNVQSLTPTQQDELWRLSKIIWSEANEKAVYMGNLFKNSIVDIGTEVLREERNQFARDLAILRQGTVSLAGISRKITLDGKWKVFGLITKTNTPETTQLAKEVQMTAEFEAIGVNIAANDLETAVAGILAWQRGSGFRIKDGELLESTGDPFVMRGVNLPHAFNREETPTAIENIASLSANTIRVVLTSGRKKAEWPAADRTTADEISSIISLCKNNKLICVLEMQDTMGYGVEPHAISLAEAVQYWISVQNVLKYQEDVAIINIGNEPYYSTTDSVWSQNTGNAIESLRRAGFEHTIMVDAPNGGQDTKGIMQRNASNVYNSDPHRNTLFSVHMYNDFKDASTIDQYLAAYSGNVILPISIGEFGNNHAPNHVDQDSIMLIADTRGIGWIAWSWSGNTKKDPDVKYLDMCTDFDISKLTTWWGIRLKEGPNGFSTSKPASIFK